MIKSAFEPTTLPSLVLDEKPRFRPKAVTDLESAGLNTAQVEGLVLKFLMNNGNASGGSTQFAMIQSGLALTAADFLIV